MSERARPPRLRYKEKKAQLEDPLHATRAAVEEGVVPFGRFVNGVLRPLLTFGIRVGTRFRSTGSNQSIDRANSSITRSVPASADRAPYHRRV